MRGRDENTGEFLGPSRSQQRREALDILELGERLVALTAAQLARLPVPDELRSDAGSFALVRAENERHRAFEARTDAWSHAQ